ncbi:MAG: hypothetical protein L3K13_03305 [Thermoplasmata archaeon]|nr:hypothetical protein [Thermoplasmata archaeon]
MGTAARLLGKEGWPLLLYGAKDRALPPETVANLAGAGVQRVARLRQDAPRAISLSFDWGVTAAPERAGTLGRAGPWALESRELERSYGPGRVLHVSLGEFARTLTAREQLSERYREGGRSVRWIRERVASPAGARDIEEARRLYSKFRAFDRPDVLHLFPTFRDAPGFRTEFPHAVPTGPLWGEPFPRSRQHRLRSWLWYASPASSDRLLPGFSQIGARLRSPLEIRWRSPHASVLPSESGRLHWRRLPHLERRAWRREFARAGLRIVTGGRSLLEALQVGGPFLYFNGVTGKGRSARQHRPEKLRSLLAAWRREGTGRPLWRDLANFARGRNLPTILERAADRPEWAGAFPHHTPTAPYAPPFDSAGALLRRLAEEFAAGTEAQALVARTRTRRL